MSFLPNSTETLEDGRHTWVLPKISTKQKLAMFNYNVTASSRSHLLSQNNNYILISLYLQKLSTHQGPEQE